MKNEKYKVQNGAAMIAKRRLEFNVQKMPR
jgi:hypothetical protein